MRDGDSEAAEELLPLVYDEFRAMAQRYLSRERPDHTLEPTALVHEAFMKLIDQSRVDWQGRAHFFAVAAQAMRRILVDHARHHNRLKRGGDRQRVSLDEQLAPGEHRTEDLVALDDALEQLAQLDARQARIVELRFFAGLTVGEVAETLGVSKRTIEGDWTMARAWLRRELTNA
jgi:RNA polymerase sigma factor (TIGR02999 family)